ncbi:Sec23/Sec24 protein transport family protein [Striga asiatica]|uniref:Sec23/Sec24 protein transport family protein n=1 Tax=Striga asiatica TaxID=4170 RepID=A0A5A7QQQ5_STRAF|nr:Sec23/Sec24 protein transport family protein [Striga asiatica]
MLELFLTVAFSAAPLTLYFPPIRTLNPFIRTTNHLLRDAISYAADIYPRLRLDVSRLVSPSRAAVSKRFDHPLSRTFESPPNPDGSRQVNSSPHHAQAEPSGCRTSPIR